MHTWEITIDFCVDKPLDLAGCRCDLGWRTVGVVVWTRNSKDYGECQEGWTSDGRGEAVSGVLGTRRFRASPGARRFGRRG